jgi:tetratricopeptide (TPR) repeat protein
MRSTLLSAVVLLAVQIPAIAADPANWVGVKVLPKLDAVVEMGDETIEDEINIPWIVQDVKGDLLFVGDQKKGWVERSQVVTMDEAPDYYTGLINCNQDEAWAYNLRGLARMENGDLDKAIADFDEAIRLKWGRKAYNNRGSAWQRKKEYDKAIADWDEATALDPDWEGPYNNIAWLRATCPNDYYRNGAKAIELATKANEMSNWSNPEYLDTLAAGYAETGDFDSAVKYENKAVAMCPNVPHFKQRLAIIKDHKPIREE